MRVLYIIFQHETIEALYRLTLYCTAVVVRTSNDRDCDAFPVDSEICDQLESR